MLSRTGLLTHRDQSDIFCGPWTVITTSVSTWSQWGSHSVSATEFHSKIPHLQVNRYVWCTYTTHICMVLTYTHTYTLPTSQSLIYIYIYAPRQSTERYYTYSSDLLWSTISSQQDIKFGLAQVKGRPVSELYSCFICRLCTLQPATERGVAKQHHNHLLGKKATKSHSKIFWFMEIRQS